MAHVDQHQADADTRELAERVRDAVDGTDYADVSELTTGAGSDDGGQEVLTHVTSQAGTELEIVVRQRRRY